MALDCFAAQWQNINDGVYSLYDSNELGLWLSGHSSHDANIRKAQGRLETFPQKISLPLHTIQPLAGSLETGFKAPRKKLNGMK